MFDTQTMKEMQKTFFGANIMSSPFELRFKILEMAKSYLDKSYEMQVKAFQTQIDLMTDRNKLTYEMWQKMMPEQYTMDEVIAKAQELYGFVESKDGKSKKDTVN